MKSATFLRTTQASLSLRIVHSQLKFLSSVSVYTLYRRNKLKINFPKTKTELSYIVLWQVLKLNIPLNTTMWADYLHCLFKQGRPWILMLNTFKFNMKFTFSQHKPIFIANLRPRYMSHITRLPYYVYFRDYAYSEL